MPTTKLRAMMLACGLLLLALPLRASHVMASDITLQNLGGDSFLVTVNVYRDCKGISLSSSPIVAAATCGGWNKSIQTKQTGGTDMTPVCKTSCTKCSNSGCSIGFGVERYQQTAIVNFSSSSCCEFVVSWEQCCRNMAINTGAGGQNYYISATINKCKIQGSTPVFQFDPIILTCKDKCVQRYQSAKGEDGDWLVYSLTEPLSGAYANIPYSTPYSYKTPFMYSGYPNSAFSASTCSGFFFDSTTAEMRFKPTNEEITVYAIKVEQMQWISGNWVKVSEVRQDVQTAVVACPPNRPPVVAGINNTSVTTLSVPVGKQLCFTIPTADADSADSLLLSWDYAIPDASFTVSKDRLPEAEFCWTPSRGYIGTTSFIVTTEEANVCPIPTIIQQRYSITVLDTMPLFTLSVTDTACATRCYSVGTGSVTTGLSFEWNINGVKQNSTTKNLCYKFPSAGKYKVQVTALKSGFYPQVLEDSLEVKFPSADAGKDTMICRGDSIRLTATGGKTYKWKTALGLTATSIANPWVKPMEDQRYYVTVTDSGGCTSDDSVLVQIDSTCVWPGDANSDKGVSLADVLNIGLAYSATGTSRANASNNFVPQQSQDWGSAIKGTDYKHIDCNGDGTINLSDLTAIGLNYGKSHPKGGIPDNDINGVPLFFQFTKDTFYASDTVSASLMLGTASKRADGAYGVTLEYEYTGKWINPGSYSFQTGCNMFCDKDGFQLSLSKGDNSAFTGAEAIVRTDHNPATGTGELGKISFVLKDITHAYNPAGEWVYLWFTNAKLIDNSGDKLRLNAISDSAFVLKNRDTVSSTGRYPEPDNIRIYPNPAKDALFVETGNLQVSSISVVNLLGQKVYSSKTAAQLPAHSIDISSLPAAIYTVVIESREGTVNRKIIIQK